MRKTTIPTDLPAYLAGRGFSPGSGSYRKRMGVSGDTVYVIEVRRPLYGGWTAIILGNGTEIYRVERNGIEVAEVAETEYFRLMGPIPF